MRLFLTFVEYFDFMNFCTQLFKKVECITIDRQSLFDEINVHVFLHFNCLVTLYHDQCPFLQFLQVIHFSVACIFPHIQNGSFCLF